MTTDLAIPDPLTEVVPQGWGIGLLATLDRIDDLARLDTARSKLAGYVAAYRKKRIDVVELRTGERMTEIRIGELLGPAPQHGGDRTLASSGQNLLDGPRQSEFRQLAAYVDDPDGRRAHRVVHGHLPADKIEDVALPDGGG